ncbi:hypothetical protein [Cohnella rhizosphaerae]|uniref:Uncharacterized protein n=1 Tax=Cohnella rhizosphaerae TaxID=1457232 RepID=A0A9X4KZ44_9BACL|nr:hypothetical protein [Cohnella rhizosphaerae]MDG0813994.1 hypothetical protein [Cohnella rhizosphaerae]
MLLSKTKPYIVMLIVLAITIVPLVPFAILDQRVTPSYADVYPVGAQQQLRAYAGDLPNDRLDAAPWRSASDIWQELRGRKTTGYFWYALALPDNRWRDPYLFVQGLLHYEVYLGGSVILERGMREPHERRFVPGSSLGRAQLPLDASADRTLYIRVYKDNEFAGVGGVYIRSYADQLAALFGDYAYLIALGFVSALIGVGALVFFFSRRDRSYLYFALFALYISSLCVGRAFPPPAAVRGHVSVSLLHERDRAAWRHVLSAFLRIRIRSGLSENRTPAMAGHAAFLRRLDRRRLALSRCLSGDKHGVFCAYAAGHRDRAGAFRRPLPPSAKPGSALVPGRLLRARARAGRLFPVGRRHLVGMAGSVDFRAKPVHARLFRAAVLHGDGASGTGAGGVRPGRAARRGA